jgi:hypothetical protein
MQQDPSSEANSRSSSKEMFRLLWNPRRFITVFTKPASARYPTTDAYAHILTPCLRNA